MTSNTYRGYPLYPMPAEGKYMAIFTRKPKFPAHGRVHPAANAAMSGWEADTLARWGEFTPAINAILDRWIAQFSKGESVLRPNSPLQNIAAVGFRLFLQGCKDGGASF
jgi:hypothetical protein